MSHVVRTLAPLAVLAAGVAVAVVLVKTRPTPQRTDPEPIPTRVRVREVTVSDQPVRVSGMGSVVAAQQVELRSEVAGRVVGLHDELVPGGVVRAGETLVRVDVRDYRLALADAQAALQKAEFDLSLERGRQKIARREFELLRSDRTDLTEDEYALALRKPHLRNVEAALDAARARVERARLDIARTSIPAPFNAVVQSESVDLGQLVNAQTPLATLVGTDAFWVQVSVPVSALDWVQPGAETEAEVRLARGRAEPIVKRGRVERLLGDLDPKGRMARLVVRVEDPLDLAEPPHDREPLLLGAYVEVTIRGRSAERVAIIPRTSLRDGDEVWLMDAEGRLEIRPVTTSFRGPDQVYVSSGLEEGDRVITSRIAAPVPGMALKLQSTVGNEPDPTTASVGG